MTAFKQQFMSRTIIYDKAGLRSITEVKQRRVRLVVGWVTAWEYRVF